MAKAEKKPAATSEGAAVVNVPVSVTVTDDPVRKLMAETGMSKAEATARINAPTPVEQPENKTE